MYDKVMNKLSNAEFFEQLVKDAAKHGIDYDSLKSASDEKIKAELHSQDGISSIQSEIVSRSEHRERERKQKAAQIQFDDTMTGVDFLDAIPGPTDEELFELECELRLEASKRKKKPLSWYIAQGERSPVYKDPIRPEWLADYRDFPSDCYASDKILSVVNNLPYTYPDYTDEAPLNFDRCLLYDGLKGDDETVPIINFSDEPEELRMLLEDHPTTEMWIAEMYRRVFHALDELPEHMADVKGRPKAAALLHAFDIIRRDRECPLPAVERLAFFDLLHDEIGAVFQLAVLCLCIDVCGGAQPMPGKGAPVWLVCESQPPCSSGMRRLMLQKSPACQR